MYDWTGKNVVYAGGFTGVGFQMVRLLMQKDIKTLAIVHRMENVEWIKKLQALNSSINVMFVQMNLMEKHSIEHAWKTVAELMDHVDVLINGMDLLQDKDVEKTVVVNLMGPIQMTMCGMPLMDKTQQGKGGLVINMSSVYGLEPTPAFAVYAAAKHGVIGFTRSMADKHIYQKTGVMFMTMCPGLTSSEVMMNLRPNATWHHSEELVDAIESAKHQTPEEAAVQIVKAVDSMKNGSMWIVNMGQLKEVMPQMHWHM